MSKPKIASKMAAELKRLYEAEELQELAKLPAFSAIVSGAGTPDDYKTLRFHLMVIKIPEEYYGTNDNIDKIVKYIASETVGQKF